MKYCLNPGGSTLSDDRARDKIRDKLVLVERLERLDYGAESRRKVVRLRVRCWASPCDD